MRVTARIPVLGLAPDALISISADCPVKDPSSGRVGRVVSASCVEGGQMDVVIDLDDDRVKDRISEKRHPF